ncbi:MAG TPA: hypothetical protein VM008_05385 [Phycisphaerae bacterium]|nr:hypothetical protein [Phycisphaerae bacterium]
MKAWIQIAAAVLAGIAGWGVARFVWLKLIDPSQAAAGWVPVMYHLSALSLGATAFLIVWAQFRSDEMKLRLGNLIASLAAANVGLFTIYASLRFLKEPEIGWTRAAFLDWSVLIFSGATTGVVTFITIWGHFQKEPVIRGNELPRTSS